MNKISRLATVFALATSLTIPILTSAQNVYCPNGSVVSDVSQCPPAATSGSVNDTFLRFYYDLVLTVVNSYFVPTLFAIAFIVFLWGVYKYFILGAADEKNRIDGRQFVLWGVIGFVVITSVWGLVNIIKSTLIPSATSNTRPDYPRI